MRFRHENMDLYSSPENIHKTEGVIFVREGRYGKEVFLVKGAGGKWYFPGGKQNLGENTEQTLAREIKEELGIEFDPLELKKALKPIENISFYRIQQGYKGENKKDHIIKNYLVTDPLLVSKLRYAKVQKEDTVTNFAWVPIKEVLSDKWNERLSLPAKKMLRSIFQN